MENEIKDEKIVEQKAEEVSVEKAEEVSVENAAEAAKEEKVVGVLSADFSLKRSLMILAAMFIGFAIGIGVTWIAFDRLNQPKDIPENQAEENPAGDKGKGKKGKKGKPGAKNTKNAKGDRGAMAAKLALVNLKKGLIEYQKKNALPGNGIVPAVDPWGNAIIVKPGKDKKSFELVSSGPDGKFGTKDDINSVMPKRGGRRGGQKGGVKAPAKK